MLVVLHGERREKPKIYALIVWCFPFRAVLGCWSHGSTKKGLKRYKKNETLENSISSFTWGWGGGEWPGDYREERSERDEGTQDVLEDNKSWGQRKKSSPSKSIFRLGSVSLIDSLQVPLINLQRSAYNYVHRKRRQKRGRKRNASENNDAIKNGNKSRARMHMKLFHLCDFYVQLAVRKVQLTLHLFDKLAKKVSAKWSERRETRIRWKKSYETKNHFRVIIRTHTHRMAGLKLVAQAASQDF